MNIEFIMEFTDSHCTLCEFPLRLSGKTALLRNRGIKKQPKSSVNS